VEVGELRAARGALFAYFTEADTSSAYLRLPSSAHAARLAASFIASTYGNHGLHACFVTMLVLPPDAYHPRPSDLPS